MITPLEKFIKSFPVFFVLAIFVTLSLVSCSGEKEPIKVGILHSITGRLAISEKGLVDSLQMAIADINRSGGVLGRKVVAVIVDGKSDWEIFAKQAKHLIERERVSVIFGCWTSACRKTVKPVIEGYDHLMFYPVQYEGLEASRNIIYTGPAPNQQIIPAVKWSMDNLGSRFFLVGSDYIFPRAANQIIKKKLSSLGGELAGEQYVLLGSDDFQSVVKKIVETKPDVIVNTVNGDSNISLFRELRKAGITPDNTPTLSFSISETELQEFNEINMTGDYAAWSYFQTIGSAENKEFVKAFKERFGENRVVNDPMEASYFGMMLWARAVKKGGSLEAAVVRNALRNSFYFAPEGKVFIDYDNNHTWRRSRIGKINQYRLFDIVWASEHPIRPVPYPIYKTKIEWNNFLNNLYKQWGGRWFNPGPEE